MANILTYNNSEIHFGDLQEVGFDAYLKKHFASAKKVIITDENVAEIWLSHFITNFPELSKAEIITIPAGEEFKTVEICEQIWMALSDYQISRQDVIINIGGGVITDLGGFVASLFKRGLPFVNVPTTLLSQVDASVGGKTGVDLGPFKNQVGVFSDAQAVFVDAQFLTTLEDAQLLSGFAEVLKHALIIDSDYWKKCQELNLNPEALEEVIEHSVKIKRDIVVQDHKENGERKKLNFGHTIGHAIEGFMLENGAPILHGYGVAWGMIAEAFISVQKGLLTDRELQEITKVMRSKFPSAKLNKENFKRIIELCYNDKKNHGGTIRCVLLNKIGEAVVDQEITDQDVLNALNYLIEN